MFIITLFLAFIIIILLLLKHKKSRYKKLTTMTVIMIMVGMICWGYTDITFSVGYSSEAHYGFFYRLTNINWLWTTGMVLLTLSVPCTLFCLLSKPEELREEDKLLEDNNDFYG